MRRYYVTFASENIRSIRGTCQYLDKVIDFLRREQADIICLQEVGTSGVGMVESLRNIWEEIKAALGMKGEYRRMYWGDLGLGRYDCGVGILSRWPILDTAAYGYEREKTGKILMAAKEDRYNLSRVLLGVQVYGEGRKLWVFTTHHTITPDGGVTEHQLNQTKRLKKYLGKYDEYVLCGDMNTPYGNENYRLLTAGLTDVSGTEPTLHPTFHKVGKNGYHVDYVFLKGEKLDALETRIPVVDASDHLPVVVELATSD